MLKYKSLCDITHILSNFTSAEVLNCFYKKNRESVGTEETLHYFIKSNITSDT